MAGSLFSVTAVAVASLLLLLATTVCAASHRRILVDTSTSIGPWEGFGVSLCWWANVFADRADVIEAAFSLAPNVPVLLDRNPNTPNATVSLPGLGLNIARYNAGASSFQPLADGAKMVASPNIPAWKQMEAYWVAPTPNGWDWSRDQKQRHVLESAVTYGVVDTVEVFSNSPVWWQCKNDNPSGADDGNDGNLKDDAQHARYIATVAAFLKHNRSLPVRSVELFNEPSASWWKASGSQEGCHIGPSQQQRVLGHLPEAMAAAGFGHGSGVRIAASDESYVDQAVSTWRSFSHTTKALIDQVNVHGYEQGGDRQLLYDLVVTQSNKILRDSEYGDGDGTGQTLLTSIMTDWQLLHPLGWCYWQVVDVAGGWGMLLGETDDNATSHGIVLVNTKYFVMAQMTRHIRPGMHALVPGDPLNLTIAAMGNGSLAVVVANMMAVSNIDSGRVTIDVQGPGSMRGRTVNISSWWTNISSSMPPLAADDGRYTFRGSLRVANFTGEVEFLVPAMTLVTVEISAMP